MQTPAVAKIYRSYLYKPHQALIYDFLINSFKARWQRFKQKEFVLQNRKHPCSITHYNYVKNEKTENEKEAV